MSVNYKHRTIFVAVPKTASQSIRTILGDEKNPHKDLKQYQSEITAEEFSSFYKFGFVRNPFDRAVSLYANRKGLHKKNTFHDFVHAFKHTTTFQVHPTEKQHQLDFFRDNSGEIAADFIGRFENLTADWAIAGEAIGITTLLPHKNNNKVASKRLPHYSLYYDSDDLIRIIYDRFAEDFEYFGYKFEDHR